MWQVINEEHSLLQSVGRDLGYKICFLQQVGKGVQECLCTGPRDSRETF